MQHLATNNCNNNNELKKLFLNAFFSQTDQFPEVFFSFFIYVFFAKKKNNH